jgi:hypothetical protein
MKIRQILRDILYLYLDIFRDILYITWADIEDHSVCTLCFCCRIYCMYNEQLLRSILYVQWADVEGYNACKVGRF